MTPQVDSRPATVKGVSMNNDEYRVVTRCLELCDLFGGGLPQADLDFITQVKHEVRMNGIMMVLRTGTMNKLADINGRLQEKIQ